MILLETIFLKIISALAALMISWGLVSTYAPPQINFGTISEVEDGREKTAEVIEEVIVKPTLPAPPGPISLPLPAPKPEVISANILNDAARNALVNILCTTKTGGILSPISGSGMLVSSNGIILTNAHVAEYFLLKDYLVEDFINCSIRTGSPATPAYKAKLLYISPEWVEKNSGNIAEQVSTGTGENDFAFLQITRKISGEPLSGALFNFVEGDFSFAKIEKNHPVFLAGYPAGFLGSLAIQQNLGIVTALGFIKDIYTFSADGTTPDLLSLGGSVVAQAGSSGGAVLDQYSGKLIGLIVTSTEAETTEERDLNAITLSHVARSFKNSTGSDLFSALSTAYDSFVSIFPQSEFDRLKNILVAELEK